MVVSSLQILTSYFSSFMASARTFHTKLNIRSDSEHPCLAQDSKSDMLKFSLVSIIIALYFCYIMLTKLRKLPSISGLLTGQGFPPPHCK